MFLGRRLKIFEEKVHPGDLARGCSDLAMTWLLCCAGAATGFFHSSNNFYGNFGKSFIGQANVELHIHLQSP